MKSTSAAVGLMKKSQTYVVRVRVRVRPTWSRAVESATLEAARSRLARAAVRQWRGNPWADLSPWASQAVRSCPEPPGATRGGARAKLGHCQGATLTTLPDRAHRRDGAHPTLGLLEQLRPGEG